jgi:hypothetical protein
MLKKKWLVGLILGITLPLILISGSVIAQVDIKEGAESDSNVLAAPPMGGFIDIRVDGLENRNPSSGL